MNSTMLAAAVIVVVVCMVLGYCDMTLALG